MEGEMNPVTKGKSPHVKSRYFLRNGQFNFYPWRARISTGSIETGYGSRRSGRRRGMREGAKGERKESYCERSVLRLLLRREFDTRPTLGPRGSNMYDDERSKRTKTSRGRGYIVRGNTATFLPLSRKSSRPEGLFRVYGLYYQGSYTMFQDKRRLATTFKCSYKRAIPTHQIEQADRRSVY
ncbi:unnamed protein product [Nesidiocoris tenuis]|uniref:Uncharacterized protein n=1 Tax=Nesidiocoris tenuis TaxID=355587 RepID=A0A6H5G892_9HEMI|nr:unnamed protein product [Nesidiocoris tenuis]